MCLSYQKYPKNVKLIIKDNIHAENILHVNTKI